MRRLGWIASLAFAFAACGGEVERSPDDGPVPQAVAAGPIGVCENRIEYALDPNDATTLSARFGYDAAGHVIRYVETSPRGGAPLTIARTYDDAELLVAQEENLPRIPPARRHVRWTYDAQRRPIEMTFDLESDPPRAYHHRFAYDAEGRLARTESETDGVTTDVATRTYVAGDRDVVEIAHDLKGDGIVDWAWRYGFSGKWLVFLESVRNGKVDVRETYVYSDLARGELAERDFDTDGDGVPNSVDRFTWIDHRLVRSTHTSDAFPTDYPQSIDWTYDASGHPTQRIWTLPQHRVETTITWTGDRPSRVARWDAKSSRLIERWSFSYGCAADRPIVVRIAPVVDWTREIEPLPFVVDRDAMWGFPEAM